MSNHYQGGCHCGNIRYQLSSALDWQMLAPRKCLCSFCVKHNHRYLSDPQAKLKVVIQEPEAAPGYRFGQKFAAFRVCHRCGVMPLVSAEIDGRQYAVININTMDGIENRKHAVAIDHDGESLDVRLQQCRDKWIPDVQIEAG